MNLGFRGEVVDFYHQYRRGYPPQVISALTTRFELTANDIVVDLGCGTGQLAVPLARRVRAVVAVDPEPDMLARGRRAAAEQAIHNLSWMLGADTDIPALQALLGNQPVGAVTIGQALHWMNHHQLFQALVPLVRPGGGVTIVTNGAPLWLQDSGWSHALRDYLEHWLGAPLTRTCGADETTQQQYRDSMAAAGFQVHMESIDYTDTLDLPQIVGGIFSALHADQLPAPVDRPHFAEQVRRALEPHAPFTEHVHVPILTGRLV